MRTSDVFPSKYLKAADVGDGERVLVISGVAVEEVGDDQKPVARFNGEKKGLVLNRTNWDRIAHAAGTDESQEWVGLKIALYTELVSFAGKSAPAIRTRAVRSPSKPVAKAKPSEEADMPPWLGGESGPWTWTGPGSIRSCSFA
jgi:hypothetical protein